MKYRIITFSIIAVALLSLLESNGKRSRSSFAQKLDRHWLNFCIANASGKIKDSAVTLVTIDDEYESTLPDDQLTRIDYAVILANIGKFQSPSVAVIPSLQWEKEDSLNQNILANQCLKLPALTLGAVVENSPQTNPSKKVSYPALTQVKGDTSEIDSFTRTISYPEKGTLSKSLVAFTQIDLRDQKNESGNLSLPLVARHGDDILPSFVLAALTQYEGLKLEDISLQLPPAVSHPQILIADRYQIPIDKKGRMKVYQESSMESPLYQSISATHLTLAHSDSPHVKELQQDLESQFQSLSKHLVVVGLDKKHDRHITLSDGKKISLAQLITRSIATIQSGRFIEQWPLAWRWLSFAAIFALAAKLYSLRRRLVFFWGGLSAFFYFSIFVMIFNSQLKWTSPFTAMILFATLILIGLILPATSGSTTADKKTS
ncbi:MAG: hypothetical protein L3J39_07075 [Verrucomicrobiales bacterium]|nr:hypothetical protein [Verrucomicrobiales bacterium]